MSRITVVLSIVLLGIFITKHGMVSDQPADRGLRKDFLVTASGNIHSESGQPDYKILYDTLLTTLEPSIEKQIINYYGYPKQYGLYDAEILSIIRQESEFDFIVKVQVTTFEHAHDPPNGKETITFKIDPIGVKAINFQHEGDRLEKDIDQFYEATLSDIKQSFNLNLAHYTAYNYNQLQYQAEIDNSFMSLFSIVEEITTNILLPERKVPNKNVIDPVTFLKKHTGYILFKKSDGTNVIYKVEKKNGDWIVTGKNSTRGKKMDYKLPWYIRHDPSA